LKSLSSFQGMAEAERSGLPRGSLETLPVPPIQAPLTMSGHGASIHAPLRVQLVRNSAPVGKIATMSEMR